jgi:hypothetical protein
LRSKAGMANRQGDVELRFAQVSAPQLALWLGLAWLGLVWRCTLSLPREILPTGGVSSRRRSELEADNDGVFPRRDSEPMALESSHGDTASVQRVTLVLKSDRACGLAAKQPAIFDERVKVELRSAA